MNNHSSSCLEKYKTVFDVFDRFDLNGKICTIVIDSAKSRAKTESWKITKNDIA